MLCINKNVVYKKYFCKNFIISSNHSMLLLNCTGRHPSFYRGIKGILKLEFQIVTIFPNTLK